MLVSTTDDRIIVKKRLFALVAALSLFLIAVRLLSSDCFLDGTVYAAIARNLAEGNGSFWHLSYTGEITPFYEHPPFGIWLESLAFRMAGDHQWIEQFWGIGLEIITLGSIGLIWHTVKSNLSADNTRAKPIISGLWWPLFLCTLPPLISWCFTNNLLENTTTPLLLLAIWQALSSCLEKNAYRTISQAIFAGILIFLALLTKGPPALFPCILPLAAYLSLGRISLSRCIQTTLTMVLTIVLCSALMWLMDNGIHDFIRVYADNQLRASIMGLRELSPSRFYLASVLMRELALPLGFAMIIYLSHRHTFSLSAQPRWGIFFLILAMSGSLPFLVLSKQMDWYIMPTLPLYGLALASWTSGAAAQFEERIKRSGVLGNSVLGISGILFVASVVTIINFRGVIKTDVGTYIRDINWHELANMPLDERQSEYTWKKFNEDFFERNVSLPPGSFITSCPAEIHDDWRIRAYLQRYYRSTLTSRRGYDYILVGSGKEPCQLSSNYRQLTTGKDYTLYHRAQ